MQLRIGECLARTCASLADTRRMPRPYRRASRRFTTIVNAAPATTRIAPITTHSGLPYINWLGRTRSPCKRKTAPARTRTAATTYPICFMSTLVLCSPVSCLPLVTSNFSSVFLHPSSFILYSFPTPTRLPRRQSLPRSSTPRGQSTYQTRRGADRTGSGCLCTKRATNPLRKRCGGNR